MVHLNERNMAARILDDLDCLNPSTDLTEDMTALEVDDSDVFTLMKGFCRGRSKWETGGGVRL